MVNKIANAEECQQEFAIVDRIFGTLMAVVEFKMPEDFSIRKIFSI